MTDYFVENKAKLIRMAEKVLNTFNIVGVEREQLSLLIGEAFELGAEGGWWIANDASLKHCDKHLREYANGEDDHARGSYEAYDHMKKSFEHLMALAVQQKEGYTSSVGQLLHGLFPHMQIVHLDLNPDTPLFRHKERGTHYKFCSFEDVQCKTGDFPVLRYQCLEDGSNWLRMPNEFFDGRFECLNEAAQKMEAQYRVTAH